MFDAVDWSRPWLASVAPGARAVGASELRSALTARAAESGAVSAGGHPLRFVPQAALPDGQAYETFIAETGQVPTRDNLHDYFNALVWLAFPRLKRALNTLQAAQIARDGVGKARGPTRDAATLFDENAAILAVREGEQGARLVEALRGHRWREALLDGRALFGTHAEVWLFGHALMEKLVAPYKAITAHTWVVTLPAAHFTRDEPARRAELDALVAGRIGETGLDRRGFTPLPVLGVPGWWDGQDACFYGDATVFRPPRPLG
jgi:hypothetical protein